MPAKKKTRTEKPKGRELLRKALEKKPPGPARSDATNAVVLSRKTAGIDLKAPSRSPVGMGWVPDIPSRHDFHLKSSRVTEALEKAPQKIKALKSEGAEPEGRHYDNIDYCAPVEDQESLGSCTANSVVGMMEYMMLRSNIRHLNLSRLFLYKVTRRLMNWTGDTGAYLRTTLQAAANFGVPPERYFPYDISRFEEEPEAFHYSFASNFQTLNYTRIDRSGTGKDIRKQLKRCIRAGLVAVFGFPVYSSISGDGDVPFPTESDTLEGGHAVLAVGFDDEYAVAGEESGTGAIIFQNSWSEDWGQGGYGFIPYRYFDEELATDIWTVLKQEWIDQSKFQ